MDDDTFELLMIAVMVEADRAAINQQFRSGATPAALTRASVRAAFKSAVLNGLITVKDPEEWPYILKWVSE